MSDEVNRMLLEVLLSAVRSVVAKEPGVLLKLAAEVGLPLDPRVNERRLPSYPWDTTETPKRKVPSLLRAQHAAAKRTANALGETTSALADLAYLNAVLHQWEAQQAAPAATAELAEFVLQKLLSEGVTPRMLRRLSNKSFGQIAALIRAQNEGSLNANQRLLATLQAHDHLVPQIGTDDPAMQRRASLWPRTNAVPAGGQSDDMAGPRRAWPAAVALKPHALPQNFDAGVDIMAPVAWDSFGTTPLYAVLALEHPYAEDGHRDTAECWLPVHPTFEAWIRSDERAFDCWSKHEEHVMRVDKLRAALIDRIDWDSCTADPVLAEFASWMGLHQALLEEWVELYDWDAEADIVGEQALADWRRGKRCVADSLDTSSVPYSVTAEPDSELYEGAADGDDRELDDDKSDSDEHLTEEEDAVYWLAHDRVDFGDREYVWKTVCQKAYSGDPECLQIVLLQITENDISIAQEDAKWRAWLPWAARLQTLADRIPCAERDDVLVWAYLLQGRLATSEADLPTFIAEKLFDWLELPVVCNTPAAKRYLIPRRLLAQSVEPDTFAEASTQDDRRPVSDGDTNPDRSFGEAW